MKRKASLILLIACFLYFSDQISAQYVPGESYFGANDYVEYIAGNIPLIISIPHGGYLEPDEIPDRNCSGCVYINDSYTQELGFELMAALQEELGCYPHIIINKLRRVKFDANRALADAADGNALVEQAWQEYHDFINLAKEEVTASEGGGLFIDLHGHGHDIQRLELGYLLTKDELMLSNTILNQEEYIEESSIRNLVDENIQGLSHSALLRGSQSFGAIMEAEGFESVPSNIDPFPLGGEPYFRGGYNTDRHGSIDDGSIDAIQIECPQNVRFDEEDRLVFADHLAEGLIEFIVTHYKDDFLEQPCLPTSLEEIKEETFHLFPNPVCDFLHLESNLNIDQIKIFDLMGQSLLQKELSTDSKEISLLQLRTGLYILAFYKNEQVLGRKLMMKECQ